jgi:5-formyltetrahydrofolate cyclo-ligase
MTAQAGDTTPIAKAIGVVSSTRFDELAARKGALRRQLRQARAAIPRSERRRAAQAAARHLARACRAWGARHVALYLALPEEIDTGPLLALLRRQGCILHVPKVGAGGQLCFTRWRPGQALRANRYRIGEPVTLVRPPRLDLVVLPLVAFDANGGRLGMGGGYYDRLLSRPRASRRPLRVGYAFAAQETAAVPVAAHDARLDAVVTERGLRRFG